MRIARLKTLVLGVLILPLVAVACGGSSDEPTTRPSTAVPPTATVAPPAATVAPPAATVAPPTATAAPAATVQPTSPTATTQPSSPTPLAATPAPTSAPSSTAAPQATSAPQPTSTPRPAPTATTAPQPTATPASTAAPSVNSPVTLSPSKDNTLYQSATGTVSNGAGGFLFAGNTNGSLARRALVAFDVAGAIPAGSTVTSVTLTLNVSRTQAGGETFDLHRLLADWGEGTSLGVGNQGGGGAASPGDATWIHRFSPGQTWAAPGGDFSPTVSASTSVGRAGAHTWSADQMVADVQGWLDDPSTNLGWLVKGAEIGPQSAKRFHSREAASAADRPTLTVEFTPPA